MSQSPPEQPHSSQQAEWRQGLRFLPIMIFFFLVIVLFLGGTAAILYHLFSQHSEASNVWVVLCCLPVTVIVITMIIGSSMYRRYGRPMGQIFSAIDSVAEGDLSVRVAESNSRQFHELTVRFNKMVGELERAEQQRRNLTADIAHELRTPLHIIQGNLEGVIDGVYQPTPEHINNTLEETRLLARLVNDLQTLSLAETGQLPLHPTSFVLADLIADLSSSFSSRAASQNVELKTNIADPALEITADYDRLNQVVSNLISNALRHTPKDGRIIIETGVSPDKPGGVRIQVKDTGAGIPPEALPFIFDRFWRGDKSRTRGTYATSGLGLSIAKQLILAHGGTISAQSVMGLGTNFIIDLPAPK